LPDEYELFNEQLTKLCHEEFDHEVSSDIQQSSHFVHVLRYYCISLHDDDTI